MALTVMLAACDGGADPLADASQAVAVPTVAVSMPATTADPAATALLRTFEGRDTNRNGFIETAENGAAEARIFDAITGDGDALMTAQELDAARAALGLMTLPGSETLVSDADQDGDQKLTLAEWMAQQGEAFEAADTDDDGRLSKAEFGAEPRLGAPGAPTSAPQASAGAG